MRKQVWVRIIKKEMTPVGDDSTTYNLPKGRGANLWVQVFFEGGGDRGAWDTKGLEILKFIDVILFFSIGSA